MSRGPLSVCRATEPPVQQANLKSQQPRCLFELSRPECRLLKGPSPFATPAPAAAPRPEGLGGRGQKGRRDRKGEGGRAYTCYGSCACCKWPHCVPLALPAHCTTRSAADVRTPPPPAAGRAFETGPPQFSQFSLCCLDLPMAPWALGAAGD